jgi:hypothetical protein
MLNEEALRRSEFRLGPSVLLADGQRWTLPMPAAPDQPHAGSPIDRDTAAILHAIREAEGRDERLRAELALGIHLLSQNYRLGAEQYQELLCFAPSSPTLASTQEAFHRLAMAYLRQLEPGPAGAVEDRRARSGGLPRPLIDALDWITGRRLVSNPVNPIGGHSN